MNHKLAQTIQLRVTKEAGDLASILVKRGTNLRDALLENNSTPYKGAFQRLNCQGMGLCGSCKVLIKENGVEWERRSCQILCYQDLEIRLQ